MRNLEVCIVSGSCQNKKGCLYTYTMGAFTRLGVNHLLPVINVVGMTATARQKDPTDIAPL